MRIIKEAGGYGREQQSCHGGSADGQTAHDEDALSSFMLLVGGSFFDGFDMYLAGGVLAAMAATGFSSVTGNAAFISFTFIGLYFGTLLAGLFRR